MSYTIQQICSVLNGTTLVVDPLCLIKHLLVDSRRLISPVSSLFFALVTDRRDGSLFVGDLYEKGVRNFVVKTGFETSSFKDANFILVDNPLRALQNIAAYHRNQFEIPVIGITGSNGKTIVKEWLRQLLQEDYEIVSSPRSYNSQIGVPLSVWQLNTDHNLAIFEAGISQPGEMEHLQQIIKPTIGVLTNIGEAHNEGFKSLEEKAKEKVMLFDTSKTIVFCGETLTHLKDKPDHTIFCHTSANLFSWGRQPSSDLLILSEVKKTSSISINCRLSRNNEEINIEVPFMDMVSVNNAVTCLAVMLNMGYTAATIGERFKKLLPVEMRMQLKKGLNNCTIINDSYSNDLSSLRLGLDYLKSQRGIKKTTAIVSDMVQSGLDSTTQFAAVLALLKERNIHKTIFIGPAFFELYKRERREEFSAGYGGVLISFYPSTLHFLQHCSINQFRDEVILLKGARSFEFETIGNWLEQKTHQTIMEVNLNAMGHNLKQHQNYLKPTTKVMAIIKAFGYGSGDFEVARFLQFNKVDYLAVAYADEGIDLRRAGINMPIMVMNPESSTFNSLVEYSLQPEIYSFDILRAFTEHLRLQGITHFPIHLKIDTGMHRLGFDLPDIDKLMLVLKDQSTLIIQSVFSHLTASEDVSLDEYTLEQSKHFEEVCFKLHKCLGYAFMRHLSNSAAIFRHPGLQYDLVRLGIGLYGVSPHSADLNLQVVATLKTTIAQIKRVKGGEFVGYGRNGLLEEDSVIATVRIGYADGYSRRFSNGIGKMLVNGCLAPVVGSVCMDMTMLNITGIQNVHEGDEVEVFGGHLPVQEVANWAGLIVYEVMTGISQRIKRIYYEE